jgi:three-Cys-motif partner protein
MSKQEWCAGYHYIDAFAGPGVHEIRSSKKQDVAQQVLLEIAEYGQQQEEQQRFLVGSPRIALNIANPFSTYVFVERSPTRVEALEALKREYDASRRIAVRKTDCNRYLLEKVVHNAKVDWRRHRAVVFLDPFGMQVPWETIAALAATGAIEVFLNFPVGMAIQRLLRRKPETFTPRQRQKLDAYFGSPEWFSVLYKRRPSLFGDDAEEKIEQSGKALVQWYRRRLREVFGYVSRAALIRNSRKGHLYYLLLASPNRTGAKIADEILSAGEVV